MHHPDLLVGFRASDDGGIYRISDDQALVQSVDFFTPIVDDPADFGAISAANALSDIYAMGGKPLTALSLVCFPYKDLPLHLLTEMTAGGAEKIGESGALIIGGHSVEDPEIKLGYAITGTVNPDEFWRNDTPQVGDTLVLTKPLGTGLITTAVKQDKLPAHHLTTPIREMKRLNAVARDLGRQLEIHAATDITGYGFFGHLYEMIRGRGLGARIQVEALPLFEGVWQAINLGAITGAHKTNREYLAPYQIDGNPAYKKYEPLLFDPQTSGGLLLALPEEQASVLVENLCQSGHRAAAVGTITNNGELCCL